MECEIKKYEIQEYKQRNELINISVHFEKNYKFKQLAFFKSYPFIIKYTSETFAKPKKSPILTPPPRHPPYETQTEFPVCIQISSAYARIICLAYARIIRSTQNLNFNLCLIVRCFRLSSFSSVSALLMY